MCVCVCVCVCDQLYLKCCCCFECKFGMHNHGTYRMWRRPTLKLCSSVAQIERSDAVCSRLWFLETGSFRSIFRWAGGPPACIPHRVRARSKAPPVVLFACLRLGRGFSFLREAFLRFFVALLSGYRRWLVYPTKANPNPVRLFNVDDFLDKLERDSRPFAEAMCDTQVCTAVATTCGCGAET